MLATVANPVEPTSKPKRLPFFNKENAREMNLRALAAKRAAAALAAQPPAEPIAASIGQVDTFSSRRLLRVRKQLSRIDALMEEETDPAKIDRLAAASSKLEEQERRLSDRSLPAVRRVAEVKAGGRSSLLSGLPDLPT